MHEDGYFTTKLRKTGGLIITEDVNYTAIHVFVLFQAFELKPRKARFKSNPVTSLASTFLLMYCGLKYTVPQRDGM